MSTLIWTFEIHNLLSVSLAEHAQNRNFRWQRFIIAYEFNKKTTPRDHPRSCSNDTCCIKSSSEVAIPDLLNLISIFFSKEKCISPKKKKTIALFLTNKLRRTRTNSILIRGGGKRVGTHTTCEIFITLCKSHLTRGVIRHV